MTQFSSLYTARLDRELGTDDATNLFTTARRKAAINEGIEEFAELTECLPRRSSLTIVGGTAEYNLNSTSVIPGGDFQRLSKDPIEFRYTDASSYVTVLAGDDLPRRDVDWLHRYRPGWPTSTVASSVAQLPELYYLRADGGALYLGFTPVPSTGSSASAKVFISYVARPTPLTSDTQEPYVVNSTTRTDLRTYHQAVVHYAAAQLEKLRRDDQASDRQMQKFLGYVARFLQHSRTKGGRAVTAVKNYFQQTRTWQAEDPRR